MPPRVSRQSVPSAGTNSQKNRKKSSKSAKSQKRALNAYATAEHTASDAPKFRAHRYGQTVEDRSSKRRRVERDEDVDEDGEDGDAAASGARSGDAKRQKRADGEDDSIYGSDSSGNEWRMGGPIGEDSDSSLDSDEAFGSSDEERFEDYTFRGSSSNSKTKKKPGKVRPIKSNDVNEMDLDEEEQNQDEGGDEDDDFGDEGVDLATMLDRSVSESDGSEDADDNDSEAEDASSQSEPESDDDNAAKISRLQDLVASLERPVTRGKTDKVQDAHESRQPSDFGVTASKKLTLADLLPTVTDPTLRKSLKVLATSDEKGASKRSAGVPGKLSAPLPRRAQDRLDRVAASAKAKEQLDRWQDTVVQNRRAEHLHFPLVDPNASAPTGATQLLSITQDKPVTELESAIQSIMEQSGLGGGKQGSEDDKLRAAEELQMKEVPVEEVLARRAALRRARELLFREEIKAKRIKKIKSKSYRRVHRKERERVAERERGLFGIDEEAERERMDRARAEERMGLKHKESKWAKSMKKSGRTVWDDDAREGIVDMARRKEELRRRIEGKDVDGQDGDSDSELSEDEEDYDEGDADADGGGDRARLERRLARLDRDDGTTKKGLAGMAFMQRAEAARKKANDQTIEEMRKELAGEVQSDDEKDRDGEDTLGRQLFGPKPKAVSQPKQRVQVDKNALEESKGSDEDGEEDEDEVRIVVDGEATSKPAAKTKPNRRPGAAAQRHTVKTSSFRDEAEEEDEWLTAKVGEKKRSKAQPLHDFIPQPMTAAEDIKTRPSETTVANSRIQRAITSKAPNTEAWTTMDAAGIDQENGSDAEAEPAILTKAQEQEMYHARAFAGDDVELAFEQDKSGLAADEDEQYSSNYLPGWGSWTGEGLSKGARKQNAKQKHNPLFKTKVEGVRAADRRDAKLKNVIISEAQQRRGKKYLASQLPHVFEGKEQYERSLRIPIGPEWTTKETFQRNTKPRVIVKQGIVAPLERPLV